MKGKSRGKHLRRKQPDLQRTKPSLEGNPIILIVCEGKNTEPSYFNQFKLASVTIEAIGEGYNTISLVERASDISTKGDYAQVWCVFDKDDFSQTDFNNAIILAKEKGFGIAYSNQSFEYWLILHFSDHQGGGMPRTDYNKKINQFLREYGLTYDGKGCKNITSDFFELLDERKSDAIKRAKRNLELHNHITPAKAESSTTVHLLVEELAKHI